MSEPASVKPSGKGLFVRQSSGLVREVSVRNALFFNTAAFIGTGVGWYPVFYALPFIAVGVAGPFSTYGWAALIVGAACVVLAFIYASLSSVMPRSGGDYVFTSRFIPKAGPFIAWVESFTLVFSSLAIIAFEVPIVVRNIQISARIIGLGTGSSTMAGANKWFTDSTGVIQSWPGFAASVVVLLLILWVVIQPTRRFHKIVTWLAGIGLSAGVVMFVFGMTVTQSGVAAGLKAQGVDIAAVQKLAVDNGTLGHGVNFSPTVFAFMMSILLFQFIGFQYSAYIAGEVRGNVKKSILTATLGALVIGVFMNSIYVDVLSRRFGFNTQVGWGTAYWLGDVAHMPLGQPNSMPLVGALAHPGLWPIWLFVSLGGAIFPFLLCPVYLNFISRISLAWSMDRQVPEWFGTVNEKVRAPLNSLMTAFGISVLFAVFQNFAILPHSIAATGRLNLVATAWFSVLMASLTWILPGINAMLAGFTRPDLIRNAPYRRALPWLGAIWTAFALTIFWIAGFKPIIDKLGAKDTKVGTYLRDSGVQFSMVIVVVAVVLFIAQAINNQRQGINTALLYREIPPD
jgi:APA family basic amino acid/polyamine antiporter